VVTSPDVIYTETDEVDGRPRPTWWIIFLLILAILGACAAWMLQRDGIVTSPDGTVYVGTAENIANGRGVSVPFTIYTDQYTPLESVGFDHAVPLRQWPPLYPLILSILVRLGADADYAPRILNPLLLGVNVVLVGLLTRRLFRPQWALLGASLALLVLIRDPSPTSSALLFLHATTFSEPLFLTFVLGSLLCIERFLVERGIWTLLGAAALASCASLTRSLGLSLVVSLAVVVLCCSGTILQRFGRTALVLVVGVAPALPSLAQSRGRGGLPDTDEVGAAFSQLKDGLIEWLPWGRQTLIAGISLVFLIVLVVILTTAVIQAGNGGALKAIAPTALFAVAALVQLLASHLLVDRYISLVGRQTSVVHLMVCLSLLSLVAASGAIAQVRRRSLATLGLVAAMTVASVLPLAQAIESPPYFRGTQPAAPLLPSEVLRSPNVFSNAPDYLYDSVKLATYLVPCRVDFYSGVANPAFDDEMADLLQMIEAGKVGVVLVGGRLGAGVDCANAFDFLEHDGVRIRRVGPDTEVVLPAS
jgi:hypothetical protein